MSEGGAVSKRTVFFAPTPSSRTLFDAHATCEAKTASFEVGFWIREYVFRGREDIFVASRNLFGYIDAQSGCEGHGRAFLPVLVSNDPNACGLGFQRLARSLNQEETARRSGCPTYLQHPIDPLASASDFCAQHGLWVGLRSGAQSRLSECGVKQSSRRWGRGKKNGSLH